MKKILHHLHYLLMAMEERRKGLFYSSSVLEQLKGLWPFSSELLTKWKTQ